MRSIQAVGRRLSAPYPRVAVVVFLAVVALALVACGGNDNDNGGSSNGNGLSGSVEVDGSSTVFPITEAIAEEFRSVEGDVRVTVGVSGTGGGFERFCAGETDVSDASRPIKTSEADICEASGVEFIEIPVAYDGLSIVVHPDNDWVSCITVEQLNMIWDPASEGSVSKWSQIDPSWPDEDIGLYGPGTDSGSFDYFTEVINGGGGASRADYTASENDNVLVQGVAGDRHAIGYFGLAYLEENLGTIAGLEVDGGNGCIAPTPSTVESGEYAPLSRPLFIYVKKESAETMPQVEAFIDYYLENVATLASDVGYVGFPQIFYDAIIARWEARATGTIFSGAEGSVADILGVD